MYVCNCEVVKHACNFYLQEFIVEMLRFPGLPNSQLITLIIYFTMTESKFLKTVL